MLNQCSFMGYFCADPKLTRTQSGKACASFTLAVERDYKPADGEKATDFIDCVAWEGKAEFISRFFAKGRCAVVKGRMQTRTWTNREGQNRKATELVVENAYFADSKKPEGFSAPNGYPAPPVTEEDEDSYIPF